MIQKLSNENLIEHTHSLFKEERRLDLEVLRHLYEIERRKLYLEKGFPSLFEMCTQEFKLSPASAQRRISAMRLLKEIPEVAHKIASGKLSVSVIAQTQSFFRAERKQERTYTKQEKLELVKSFENKSARDVEKELAAKNPHVIHYESAKPVSQTQTKLTVILDNDTKAMLDQIKDLISHANPDMTYECVITRAAKLLLEKELKKVQPLKVKQPKSKDQASLPTSEVESKSHSAEQKRRPSAELRKFIWQRDEGKCTYIDLETGHTCGSKSFLQFDHIQPWSMNGKTTKENLRLLCGAHNRARR